MSSVLFEELPAGGDSHIGVITLNSEKTLNALSLEMIDLIFPVLNDWRQRKEIALVVFQGAGERAFCAGGDIQELYYSMVRHPGGPNPYAESFFEREYRLDYLIHTFEKPTLVWGHGFVMGGGLGVYSGCSHRIVTETTRIACPEITIGLFPDAGASVFLSRMPRHLASFMALTGCQINATDAKAIGLAEYRIPWQDKALVMETLVDQPWSEDPQSNRELLDRLLNVHQRLDDSPEGELMAHEGWIADLIPVNPGEHFVAEFSRRLDTTGTDDRWLQKAIRTFRAGSPTTAHIVAEQIERIQTLTLEEMFALELTVAVQCSRHPDFTEGIRALLIDKDNAPRWAYPYGQVSREWLLEHFEEPWENGNPLADLSREATTGER